MVLHNFVPVIPVFHSAGDFPYLLRRATGRELWNCGARVIKRQLSRQGFNLSLPSFFFFLTAVGLFLLHSVSSPDCIERSWWWIHFEIYGVGGKKSLLVILLNFVVSSSQESLCCNCLHAVAHCFSSSTWKSHSTFSTIYLPTEDPSSKAQFQSYYKN